MVVLEIVLSGYPGYFTRSLVTSTHHRYGPELIEANLKIEQFPLKTKKNTQVYRLLHASERELATSHPVFRYHGSFKSAAYC
jgi:hypothetical protein